MEHDQKLNSRSCSRFVFALTAGIGLCLVTSIHAAGSSESAATRETTHESKAPARWNAAQKCLGDLRGFLAQIRKDGYWVGGSDYGYGYPMFGHADVAIGASSTDGSGGAPPTDSYLRERPGQDVRALIGSAKILAQLGQQQACEALLAATRDIYKDYAAALRADKVPLSDAENWRRTQISSAKPVSDANPLVNSEQLVGVEVVNPQGEDLGSVDDIVYGSQGEVIAYLVIQRGGLFGHPVADVAVPWQDFKVTSRSRILVLDSTKSNMDLAPQVKEDQFALPGGSGRQSQNVDNFWKKHLSN